MGIAASKSGSVPVPTNNSTLSVNSTAISASSAPSLVSASVFSSVNSSSAVVTSSASLGGDRNLTISSILSSSLSSVALSTSTSSPISSAFSSSSIQRIAASSSSLIQTEAAKVPANATLTSVQLSSQPTTSSTSVISKASMSSSSASVTSTTTGSGDDSAPTNISNSSTSSASSTTTATATTSSERLSSLSSSAPSNPTSSSQSDLPSSSGTSAGSSTQAANGPSSTPPVPSGQSQSSVDGGQVAANSAGSIGTAGSTSVEVVTTQTFPSSTVTSTITGHPDSTLSTPSGITVSSNGRLSTTFPALITVVSTSTNANGAETVWTSIVANPTNEVSGDVADAHSFLHNEGAVAGVFTVVGIAFTAAVVAIFMICRRRRRRKTRRNQWIDNIQKRLPEPEDPFENPREAPVMRSMSQTSRNEQHYHFQSPSPTTAQPFFHSGNPWDIDEEFRSPPGGIVQSNSLGLTSIDATRMSPFSDSQYPHQEHVGLAVTTSSPPAHQSRPSLAQSSPSIYPPSIPLPNDNASVYEDIDLMGQSNEPTVTIPNPYIYPISSLSCLLLLLDILRLPWHRPGPGLQLHRSGLLVRHCEKRLRSGKIIKP
ncbi:hypothetical protein F5879DRAFT_60412 [Lentinula edodes]|nr:hypothetical protein F5879DRAFT_60412 [Lentinula edodes]